MISEMRRMLTRMAVTVAMLTAPSSLFISTAGAQQNDSTAAAGGTNPYATVMRERQLPLVTTKIRLLTRSYGDSIVLRWLAEDWVSYKYLADFGVNVLRVSHRELPADPSDLSNFNPLQIDTLAYALKPLTLEQFRAKYAADDSLALVPQGLLWGEAENYKQSKPGTMTHNLDLNSEQDITYALAMMVAEWRKDLAEDMAVRLTDRTAEPGVTYDYYVQPTRWENGGRLIFEPGVVEGVDCRPYQPEVFNPRMTDSLSLPGTLTIGWWDDLHSSYEIERRQTMTLDGEHLDRPWERISQKPYVSMVEQPEGEDYCLLGDSVPYLGLWEYRILAYDAFGDLTMPTRAHEVMVPDIQPPSAPLLKRVVVERPDDDDPMARVIAHIIWEKPDLEPDLVGYVVNYHDMRNTTGEWITLNDEIIAPTDTVFTIDMTGRRTGMLVVSAYDQTGNESRSLMQQINLTDYRAPAPPDSLQAYVLPVRTLAEMEATADTVATAEPSDSLAANDYVDGIGVVLLSWQQNPLDDDVSYWDVAFANDSTHPFLTKAQVRVPQYADTLVLDVNQKYIYYRVRAVDYSNNFGDWCPWIRVVRPHDSPPTQPHLDTSSHSDEKGMHMEWVVGTDADMLYHMAYRRLGDNGPWELIGRYDADSLRQHNYTITIDDDPPYDRRQRYYYMIESVNSSPYTSQSLAVSWLHRGLRTLDIDVALQGAWVGHDNVARLTWTHGDVPQRMAATPYYYCVFRKGPGDKRFRYQMDVYETEYTDRQLRPGETADYYVLMRFEDGRESRQSNTVSITRDK